MILQGVEAGLHLGLDGDSFVHLVSILLCGVGALLLDVFDELVQGWFFQHELVDFVSVYVCLITENVLHELIYVFVLQAGIGLERMIKPLNDYDRGDGPEQTIQEEKELVLGDSALELKTKDIDDCFQKYFIRAL